MQKRNIRNAQVLNIHTLQNFFSFSLARDHAQSVPTKLSDYGNAVCLKSAHPHQDTNPISLILGSWGSKVPENGRFSAVVELRKM